MLKIYNITKDFYYDVHLWGYGKLALIISIAGCNLDCDTCKDKEIISGNTFTDLNVNNLNLYEPYKYVVISGGEPLLQEKQLIELVLTLQKRKKFITIVTNGSLYIPDIIHNEFVSWIINYRLPSTNYTDWMITDWYHKLNANDFVKFELLTDTDFEFAMNIVQAIKEVNTTFFNFAFTVGNDSQILYDNFKNNILNEFTDVIYI